MLDGYTYLVQQDKYYKIGYTTNVKGRMAAYDTHAPNFTLLGCIPGNCEKELHKRFLKYHYKKEWFNENQEILDEFNKNGVVNLNSLMTEDDPIEGQRLYTNTFKICVDIETAVIMYNNGYDECCNEFVKIIHDKNGIEDDIIKGFCPRKNYGIEEFKDCRNSVLEKYRNKNNDADAYVAVPTIGDAIQWMIDKYGIFIQISYIKINDNFYFHYDLIDLKTGFLFRSENYNESVDEYDFAVDCAIKKFFKMENKYYNNPQKPKELNHGT